MSGFHEPSKSSVGTSSREGMGRRTFLAKSSAAAAGMAAMAAILGPLRDLEKFTSVSEFLQKHYKELTPEEMKGVLVRIRRDVERQYGVQAQVADYKPMNGVEFVYALYGHKTRLDLDVRRHFRRIGKA